MNPQAQIDLEEVSDAIKIDGPLSIASVAGLQELLTRYVNGHAELQIDLSGIATCDAAGLQLIYSLFKSAAALGKPCRIVAVSEPFTALAEALGVAVESLTLLGAQAEAGRLPAAGAAE